MNKYYNSAYSCRMTVFIEVLMEGDVRLLIIEGEPSDEELQAAWETILSAYSELSQSNEQKLYFSMLREIKSIEINVYLIQELINKLKTHYAEPVLKELKRLTRLPLSIHPDRKEEYDRGLLSAQAKLTSIQLGLDLKKDAAKAMEKKMEGGQAADRSYFEGVIITLSGDGDLRDSLTVFQYCERLRRHLVLIEKQNKK